VFAAIAAFILLRYRAMLGQKTERDDAIRPNPTPLPDYERVIQLPATRVAPAPDKKDDYAQYGTLAATLTAMRTIDREFTPEEFLTGARAAYEMVIAAFSKSDRDTLKLLLSDDIYKSFDGSLARAQSEGRIQDTTLLAISKADMQDAKLKGNIATITVDFLSEQVHLIRGLDGAIIEGNPSQQEPVEDRWVFTRNLANSDPNWKIIET